MVPLQISGNFVPETPQAIDYLGCHEASETINIGEIVVEIIKKKVVL
jgi:hypothetical protein